MRRTAFAFCLGLVGCGPISQPMVHRLKPEGQEKINGAWENMLTPPDRLDRMLLLDVVTVHQLHQLGVDRLYFHSQKDVPGGAVRMQLLYDREKPDLDEFTITCLDQSGGLLRREEYTRDEVEGRLGFLFGGYPENRLSPTGDGEPVLRELCPEDPEAWEAARRERMEQIRAATQPADAP